MPVSTTITSIAPKRSATARTIAEPAGSSAARAGRTPWAAAISSAGVAIRRRSSASMSAHRSRVLGVAFVGDLRQVGRRAADEDDVDRAPRRRRRESRGRFPPQCRQVRRGRWIARSDAAGEGRGAELHAADLGRPSRADERELRASAADVDDEQGPLDGRPAGHAEQRSSASSSCRRTWTGTPVPASTSPTIRAASASRRSGSVATNVMSRAPWLRAVQA